MLTNIQKKTFQDLEDGKLTTKQKADFYYRLSGILKNDLEGLEDITHLLDELPPSYLEKIDYRKAALDAIDLLENLIQKLGPAPVSAHDDKGIRHVIRHYNVDLGSSLPGSKGATAHIKTSYEPSKEEIVFFNQLMGHIGRLEGAIAHNEHDPRVYTPDEFNQVVLPALKARGKNFQAETTSIVGWENTDVKESSEQFYKSDEAILGKKEEPK
jgi:hypothetical protein